MTKFHGSLWWGCRCLRSGGGAVFITQQIVKCFCVLLILTPIYIFFLSAGGDGPINCQLGESNNKSTQSGIIRSPDPDPDLSPSPPPTSYKMRRILNSSYFHGHIGSNDIRIHSNGLWSGTDAAAYHKVHHAYGLSSRLVQFFKREAAQSVIDLGGGSGLYVQNLIDHGIFASCYDGNPDTQAVSNGTCATADLTKPLHLAKHDWVLSLSVGRQILPKFEDTFVRNVDAVNSKGIVIYWGDGRPVSGKLQKCVRNNSQVISKFESLGHYVHDQAGSNFLKGSSKISDYSVLVFRRKEAPAPARAGAETINLAVVSCGMSKFEEALTMIKSAILFSQQANLRLFAFTDNATRPLLQKQLQALLNDAAQIGLGNFEFEVLLDSFPASASGMTPWSEMFAPCSLQRLFLPSVLPRVDSIIYADADTIFLSDLRDLWRVFKEMNSTQLIAAGPLTEKPAQSWFVRNGLPHYGETGVNCGFTLMNLTKMRAARFEELISDVRDGFEHLRPNTTGDQFLQNILYSFHPEFVKVLPCRWNLRRMHCACKGFEECGCSSALADGVGLIHGTKNGFTDKIRLPLFRHIYEQFKTYDFQSDNLHFLLAKLKRQFRLEEDQCFFNRRSNDSAPAAAEELFYKSFEQYSRNL